MKKLFVILLIYFMFLLCIGMEPVVYASENGLTVNIFEIQKDGVKAAPDRLNKNDTVNVKINLTNTTGQEQNLVCILALYNQCKMMDVKTSYISISEDETTYENAGPSLIVTDMYNLSIAAYLLEDINDIAPVTTPQKLELNNGPFNFHTAPSYNIIMGSDAVFVAKESDEYLMSFFPSDDLLTVSSQLRITSYKDGYDKSPTYYRAYNHRFGHCNSIDYNQYCDSLIFGNGSGDYNLENKFYIIPNVQDTFIGAPSHTEDEYYTLESVNAIPFDCSTYNFGSKLNVIWGERNEEQYNIAYMITNDNGIIRKIMLGMGDEKFEYGEFIPYQDKSQFNGTFKILEEYFQDNCSYDTCNQGCFYYNGQIIANVGHDAIQQWFMTCKDGKIASKKYSQYLYDASGICLPSKSTNGIAMDKNSTMLIGTQMGTYVVPIKLYND